MVTKFTVKLKSWFYLLTTLLLLSVGSDSAFAAITGSGTQADPYKIGTPADWNTFAQNIASSSSATRSKYNKKYVELTADLDFTINNEDFYPIGGFNWSNPSYTYASAKAATIFFNGNNHKIKAESFKWTKGSCMYGAFGLLASTSTVENLIIDGFTVDGGSAMLNATCFGGIVGQGSNITIKNCMVCNTTINGGTNDSHFGGICGTLNGGTIDKCVVVNTTITKSKGDNAAGLVGYIMMGSKISNCYADVSINSSSQVAGFVGFIETGDPAEKVTFEDCFCTGSIKTLSAQQKEMNNGGFVGRTSYTDFTNCGSSVTMQSNAIDATYSPNYFADFVGNDEGGNTYNICYAAGKMTFGSTTTSIYKGINTFIGFLSAMYNPTTTEANCFYEDGMLGSDYFIGTGYSGTPLAQSFVASDDMVTKLNGLNSNSYVWTRCDDINGGYPFPVTCGLLNYLTYADSTQAKRDSAIAVSIAGCDYHETKAQTVFHLKNADDVKAFADSVAKSATWSIGKTAIVDNDITGITSVIGTESTPFLGTFNGNNHLLSVNLGGTNNVGLIGVAGDGATIQNVSVTGTVSGSDYVGAVVGKITGTVTVTACANAATVTGTGSYVGGIAGNAATLTSCVNVGTVTGADYVGGIAGQANTVKDCSNAGWIKGTKTNVGGIAGSATLVSTCLNTGVSSKYIFTSNSDGVTGSVYDLSVATAGDATTGSFAMNSATKVSTLSTNWTAGTIGMYPVPTALDTTRIAKLSMIPLYVEDNTNVYGITLPFTVSSAATFSSSTSGLFNVNGSVYTPIKTGTTTFTVSAYGISRQIPVTVVNPGYYSGGFGNEYAPYLMSKAADFEELSKNIKARDGLDKYYALTKDITEPVTYMIGSMANQFQGSLTTQDGNCHTINVDINQSGEAALFPVVKNATFKNIWLTGSVTGGSDDNSFTGAFVGKGVFTMSNCGSDVIVKGGGYVGGIVGQSQGAILNDVVNLGSVTSTGLDAGGIAGSMTSASSFTDCMNAGMVTGVNAAGIGISNSAILTRCLNTGVINGSTQSDAIAINAGTTNITYSYFDNQLSVATAKTGTATTTNNAFGISLDGWTSGSSVYPVPSSCSDITILASAPVLLSEGDTINDVKHDFKVSTANSVTWASTTGVLTVKGGSVIRKTAGADTLVATLNGFTHKIPVYVTCVPERDTLDTVYACNTYKGTVYTETKSFWDEEVTALPGADCGHITSYFVHVGVGSTETVYSCDGVYNGKTYYKDTIFVDSATCDVVDLKVKTPSIIKNTVNLNFTDAEYTYKDYTVKRTTKPIVDSLICTDTIKSNIKDCKCDSAYVQTIVNLPSYYQYDTINGGCSPYTYTYLDGTKKLIDNYTFEDWNNPDFDGRYGNINVVVRDTDLTANLIKITTVKLYRTYMEEDLEARDVECDSFVYTRLNGDVVVFKDPKYLTATTFIDTLKSTTCACDSAYRRITIKIKGFSTLKDTVKVGAVDKIGYCDVVSLKLPGMPRKINFTETQTYMVNEDQSDTSCGVTTPYYITVNKSPHTPVTLHACGSLTYTRHSDGKDTVFTKTGKFEDRKDGVVPACGCDSIWDVDYYIHKTIDSTEAETACDSYTFTYLDKSRASLLVEKDTVIKDTLKSACTCGMACDSIIRVSTITIHHSNPASENDTVKLAGCEFVDYLSPNSKKASIRVYSDSLLYDTLTNQYGCDSIIPVKFNVEHPVVIDTLMDVMTPFVYTDVNGDQFTFTTSSYLVVAQDTITDYRTNSGEGLCDTVMHIVIRTHATGEKQVQMPVACDTVFITLHDGSKFKITKPDTIRDTIKSQICGLDSLITVYTIGAVGRSYTTDNVAEEDMPKVQLYGCDSEKLIYTRNTNDWNEALTKSFSHGSATYTWTGSGASAATTGYSYDTMHTIVGCDSLVRINITFDHLHIPGIAKQYTVCHEDAPFRYKDYVFNAPSNGSIKDTMLVDQRFESTTGGCDTVYSVRIRVHGLATDVQNLSGCGSVDVPRLNGETLTVTKDTTFNDTLKSSTCGCDSIVRVYNVKVGYDTPADQIDTVTLVDCDTVFFKDKVRNMDVEREYVYNRKQTYPIQDRILYKNIATCDSVVPLKITVNRSSKNVKYETVCGFWKVTDQFRRVHMFVNNGDADTVVYFADTFATAQMCDSIISYNITIKPIIKKPVEYIGCGEVEAVSPVDSIRGSFADLPTQLYKADKEAFDTTFYLPNSVLCDTAVYVHITVNPILKNTRTIEDCEFVTYKDKTYSKDTLLIERYESKQYNCDSIDTVHIVVHPVIRKDSIKIGCGVVTLNKKSYKEPIEISDTIRYKSGCKCDSIITTYKLDVKPVSRGTITEDSCMYLTAQKVEFSDYNRALNVDILGYVDGDTLYKQSQHYYMYGDKDVNNCDSVIEVNLNVNNCYPYPVIINKYDWMLVLNKDYVGENVTGYHWYKDGQLLRNANLPYYSEDGKLSGCYKAHVVVNDTLELESEEVCIDTVQKMTLKYDLYPDPVKKGQPVYLDCSFDTKDAVVEVFNVSGIKVYRKKVTVNPVEIPSTAHTASGYYFVKLTTKDGDVITAKYLVK